MARYKCHVCKEEFEDNSANPVCPTCGASGDKVEKISN